MINTRAELLKLHEWDELLFGGFYCTHCTPAWTLGHGEPVVSVEGYAGGICLDHVDVITEGASA